MESLGHSPPLHGCLLMKEPHVSLLFIEKDVYLGLFVTVYNIGLQMENIISGTLIKSPSFI